MSETERCNDDLQEVHEFDESSLHSYDSCEIGIFFDGFCSTVVETLLQAPQEIYLDKERALFVPISIFEEFKMEIVNREISIADEHVWDYNVIVGDTIHSMKLIWIQGLKKDVITIHPLIKKAFQFLQPRYLRYMDKPFQNRDAITQVNLILNYHRTQKRRWGIIIFNICDLITFKMAIDDNRYEYENCEFHKIIDRTLVEMIESGINMKDVKFDFNEYLGSQYVFQKIDIIFEYLVYHFQKTIGSIIWDSEENFPIKFLTDIKNVPEFLEFCSLSNNIPNLLVTETNLNGKCSQVLYEILSKAEDEITFEFKLDGEWVYSGDCLLNEIPQSLSNPAIRIITKNTFSFIENFVNWLKLSFGKQSQDISLDIYKYDTINPYIFNGFHIKALHFGNVKLEHKLIRMLKKCNYSKISLEEVRIENDNNQRFEFLGSGLQNDQNIFKLLDELHNCEYIELCLEEHTIGTLFAYVASVMMDKKITEFNLKNMIRFGYQDSLSNYSTFKFLRSVISSEIDQIEMYTSSGDRIDFYELLNNVEPRERQDFDFYE